MAFRLLSKQPAVKLNCWEYKKCGREPGGRNVGEFGVCPAASEVTFHGIFGGKNSGRACWVVAGTFCKGEIQGTFAQKFKNCSSCDFYKRVQKEETPHNYSVTVLLSYLNQTHEKRVEERTLELEKARSEIASAMKELESANSALTQMYRELERSHRVSAADMRMASRIQSSFFPRQAPASKEWDVAFSFRPMSGVSGDLYDFYSGNSRFCGASLFDVSGHGIASGLITLLARSIIFRHFMEGFGEKLGVIMERINRDLISEMENIDNYLTGILLRFSGDHVEYVNAGHTDLLVRRASGQVRSVEPRDKNFKGRFLGVAEMESRYDTVAFKVQKGDVLLIFSDCLNEGENSAGEQYGVDGIVRSLEAVSSDMSSAEILKHVVDSYVSFVGASSFQDDLTVILLKRNV